MVTEFHGKYSGYVAWSGGKDSTLVVREVTRIIPQIPVVWFDSGFEFPETREYIYSVASSENYNLHVIPSRIPGLDLLESSGVWTHRGDTTPALRDDLHSVLVTEPSREAHTQFGEGEMLGLRKAESKGRNALLVKHRGVWEKRYERVAVACPVWDWSDSAVERYYYETGFPKNPVYDVLTRLGVPGKDQRVGLVLDGNGLVWGGRGAVLRAGWPALWHEVRTVLPRLEEWR